MWKYRNIRPVIPDILANMWREYVLLEDKNVVQDMLKFPEHSKDSPRFIGSCN